jgi:phosphoribosylglycinamide formyltransferase 1
LHPAHPNLKPSRMLRKRVAILISGRGANMAALIAAAKDSRYPAEIAVVVSNRVDAAGVRRAAREGIATVTVEHARFGTDREGFERALQAVLTAHDVELVCLAGFLRLFTPWFVSQWSGRMINIHPALLPSFKGLHTHERALAAGVKIHGATVHFVVPDMDSGPIIAQAAVPVLDDDTPDTLAARVLAAELRIYPLALGLVAAGKTSCSHGRVSGSAAVSPAACLIVPDPI